MIDAIVLGQNQKENAVSKETQIIIITRAFRILEGVWQRCGSQMVWETIRSSNDLMPKYPKENV
jgi:hypothetical protein